jgi:hypothetical protein
MKGRKMEEIMMSPSVKKEEYPKQQNFLGAILDINAGHKVTKVEWDNKEEYGFMKDEIVSIHRNGKDHGWLISKADIEGEDWFRLEDK